MHQKDILKSHTESTWGQFELQILTIETCNCTWKSDCRRCSKSWKCLFSFFTASSTPWQNKREWEWKVGEGSWHDFCAWQKRWLTFLRAVSKGETKGWTGKQNHNKSKSKKETQWSKIVCVVHLLLPPAEREFVCARRREWRTQLGIWIH